MPKAMERRLKAKAKKMGMGPKKSDSYVYGSMRKTGWSPSQKKGKK